MSVQKIEPRKRTLDVKRMTPLANAWEEMFEDFPPRRWMETFEPFGFNWPTGVDLERSFRIDVVDRDKELVVRGELPGIDKDDVEITLLGDRLMIEAERKFEEKDEKDTFYRHEVGYGKLLRTIPLPVAVDRERVTAELRDGVLDVRLPKVEAVERHTVKVA